MAKARGTLPPLATDWTRLRGPVLAAIENTLPPPVGSLRQAAQAFCDTGRSGGDRRAAEALVERADLSLPALGSGFDVAWRSESTGSPA
jgi:hypothetical protein